jgi:nucleotide-binding universal stress UspA family protein
MSYKRILTGTDGSPPSLEAVRHAATVAKASGAELVIIAVYRPVDPVTVEQWKEQAPEEFAWRLGPASPAEGAVERGAQTAHELGVEARTRIEQGDPADTILKVAELEDADLIVVGNRGMEGPSRFLLGSVPNVISHHAPCDVLIVKTYP